MAKQETLKTVRVYDQMAAGYRERSNRLDPTLDLPGFTNLLPIGGSVLDAGCGYGRELEHFSRIGLHAVGTDLSRNMLRLAKSGEPGLEVVSSEVMRLPFKDSVFDGIWCRGVLHHIEDSEVAGTIEELKRVLKPNGILFVLTREGVGNALEPDNLVGGKQRYLNFFTTTRLTSLLHDCGFAIIDSYHYNERERYGFLGRIRVNFAVAIGKKKVS